MKRIFLTIAVWLLVVLILITGCSSIPFFKPALTATSTVTNTPEATATPKSTSTPTATPTPNPVQFAKSVGLSDTRSYDLKEIDGVNYLVDTYNSAPKAIEENGVWQLLDYHSLSDAEIMYGQLVKVEEVIKTTATVSISENFWTEAQNNPYIHKGESSWSNNPGYTQRTLMPIYLGDWFTREIKYKDKMVTVFFLLMGIRNNDGEIRIVEMALDSPDIEPGHTNGINCREGDSWGGPFLTIEDLMKFIKPGMKFNLDLPKAISGSQIPASSMDSNPVYAMQRWFTNNYPENQLTQKEYSELTKTAAWPDRVITVYYLSGYYYGPDGKCQFNQ